jgi:hypothetical protein
MALALWPALPAVAIPPWRPLRPAGLAASAADGRQVLRIGGEVFRLEVAADTQARMRGLMERPRIEPDGGMLFIFPEPALQSFWMANCLVDIDIAYVDDRGVIVATHQMRAEPLPRRGEPEWRYEARLARYPSRVPVRFAIELAAGTLRRLGIGPGDVIAMDTGRLARMAR